MALRVLFVAAGVAIVVTLAVLVSGVFTDGADKRPSTSHESLRSEQTIRPRVKSRPKGTPTYIEIRGQQVPLAPGMITNHYVGAFCNPPCPTTSIWKVTYDLSAEDPPDSWIIFDQDFNLLESRIFSGDMELFQPLLDALNPPYDIFASPPAYMFIRDKQVPLAPGMSYGQGGPPQCDPSPCPQEMSWRVSYAVETAPLAYSRLVFDEDHNLVENEIRPEHQDEFKPLLDVLLASIIIRGEPIPLVPGMTYAKGMEVCDAGSCRFRGFWHVDYDFNPDEAGESRLVFNDDFRVIQYSVRPEDQEEFQPLLDAFAAP